MARVGNEAAVWLSVAVLCTFTSSGALAASPPRSVWIADAVSGEGVPPRLAEKAAEFLAGDLASRGVTVTALADLRRATKGAAAQAPDLREALSQLEQGKDLYLNLEFQPALQKLTAARSALEAALPSISDPTPLMDALAYTGATRLGMGDEGQALASFAEMLRFWPGHELDPRIYPPEVLGAFDKAKSNVALSPRARLSVSSAPPLAKVFVDGRPRGETPLVLDGVSVGRHALRVELADHQPHVGWVDVTSSGTPVEVRLQPSRPEDAIAPLAAELRARGDRQAASRAAATLARTAGIEGVAVLGLVRSADRFALGAAIVSSDGTVRAGWTAIDGDFLSAPTAVRTLAEALVSGAPPGFAPSGVPPPPAQVDFAMRLLGISLVPDPDAPPPAEEAPSIFTRWWFWGGVVAIGAASAGGYYLLAPPRVVQQPNTLGVQIEVPQ